ncbi:glutamine amidotransferase [Labrys miyagiensis]|uniref:Glutamine amidotransferase n=1 Tax=Labrys miyagiensis TaxID=346912 RepID=A0ABQ6CLW5_9HYPH|nr:type 1 glutamine amidotransferase [Labrys miyagiensis]GLS20749.1 glutamine amidotransferase [Labrys miyagiensis]
MSYALKIDRERNTKRIGILQTDHAPGELIAKHGDYNEFFIRSLADERLHFDTYAVVDGVFPGSVTDADGWLITGAEYSVHDRHDWIGKLERLIREIFDARIPMIGICFGHEIIAQALGGRVGKSGRGWTVGPVQYERSDLKQIQTIIAWHQDQVTVKPALAERVGSSADCENAVLRYGSNVLTYQGHPEITPDYIRDLLQLQGQHLSEAARRNVLRAADACLSASDVVLEIKEMFLGKR